MAKENQKVSEIELFCLTWLNFTPYLYQAKFLRQAVDKKRVAALWCRQTGKSFSVAAYCIYEAVIKSGQQILIVSPTQRQSSELFNKIKNFVHSNPNLNSSADKFTQTEIIFDNGSRIISLPCGDYGESIRGFTADVLIIEESGYVKDSIVSEVLMPMIASTQGKVIQIGTPKGTNHFYEACYGQESPYLFSHITWREAVEVGQYEEDFIDEQRNNLTNLEFRTEYEAKFIPDEDRYFPQPLIDTQTRDLEVVKQRHSKAKYWLGVDFARLGEDSSVFVVIEQPPFKKHYRVANIVETRHKKLTDAIGRIKMLDNIYQFEMMYLDETGLGAGPSDVLREELGGRVKPITFTTKSKQDMFSNCKIMLEKDILYIPNHKKLLYQMADLRYEVMSSGQMKIHHSAREKDDYVDGLVLACQCHKSTITPSWHVA